jgi:hypothetical protein
MVRADEQIVQILRCVRAPRHLWIGGITNPPGRLFMSRIRLRVKE